jgi:hypothetical protein
MIHNKEQGDMFRDSYKNDSIMRTDSRVITIREYERKKKATLCHNVMTLKKQSLIYSSRSGLRMTIRLKEILYVTRNPH